MIAVAKDKGKRHGKTPAKHQTRRIHDSSSEILAPTQDEFSLMNTADNNNDKICWTWNEERQEFYSRYTTNIDMDDYLFLAGHEV